MERRTLPGPDYYAPAVFELEKERIFYRSWFLAGRAEHAPEPGDWFTVQVLDESVLVVRGEDEQLRAFYNVCRHRGSRLKEEPSGSLQGAIACPYHDWCYSFTSGDLVATPRVGKDEVDRSKLGLRTVHLDEWQGFVYVNLDRETPRPVRETLGAAYDDMLTFERFDIGSLRIGATTEWLVKANWKIIIENYNECLHCPNVHPELVQVIPAYKKGWVFEEGREDGGVGLAGTTSYAPPGGGPLRLRRHHVPQRHARHRRHRRRGHAALPDRRDDHAPGRVVPLPPRRDGPGRLRPVGDRRVRRARRRPGQRDLRACAARRPVARVRGRWRLPGEGPVRLGVQPALPQGPRRRTGVLRARSASARATAPSTWSTCMPHPV